MCTRDHVQTPCQGVDTKTTEGHTEELCAVIHSAFSSHRSVIRPAFSPVAPAIFAMATGGGIQWPLSAGRGANAPPVPRWGATGAKAPEVGAEAPETGAKATGGNATTPGAKALGGDRPAPAPVPAKRAVVLTPFTRSEQATTTETAGLLEPFIIPSAGPSIAEHPLRRGSWRAYFHKCLIHLLRLHDPGQARHVLAMPTLFRDVTGMLLTTLKAFQPGAFWLTLEQAHLITGIEVSAEMKRGGEGTDQVGTPLQLRDGEIPAGLPPPSPFSWERTVPLTVIANSSMSPNPCTLR